MMRTEKYFFAFTICAALVVTFYLLLPFFTYLLVAAILTYFLRPVQSVLLRYVKSPALSAAILIVLVILVVVLPTIFLTTHLVQQVTGAYASFKEGHAIERVALFIQQKTGREIQFQPFLLNLLGNVRDFLLGAAPNFLGSLTRLLLGLFVMFFVMYYALQQSSGLTSRLTRLIPLEPELKEKLFIEVRSVLQGVLYGQVVTALVQGLLGGIGFLLFGVGNAIFWGVMMMILSFLPLVGTPIIWIPAGVYLLIEGQMGRGIGLLLYSAIVVANVDNVLKPRLISGKSKIHPAVVMIGVLGGLRLFGFIGLVIGPLVLALLIRLLEFYEDVYLPRSGSMK